MLKFVWLTIRHRLSGAHVEVRKQQSVDVLVRAKELGMKIWALEKFQRMMTALFDTDTDTGTYPQHAHYTRSSMTTTLRAVAERSHESNLAQLLRNERHNGPADRDRTVATREMIPFKGPFIYVHDMDEKIRPILVRDYPKAEKREDGIWPQFRSVHEGRCPFVDDSNSAKRQGENRKEREEERRRTRRDAEDDAIAARTRVAVVVAQESPKMQPPLRTTDGNRRRYVDMEENMKPMRRYDTVEEDCEGEEREEAKTMKAPQLPAVSHRPVEPTATLVRSNFPPGQPILGGRFIGGEPLASGMQPSNITSAIRSQMISSTAATGPGAKAGTNKEVFSLQRKILEKQGGSCATSNSTMAAPAPWDVYTEMEAATASHATSRVSKSTTTTRAAQAKPKTIVEEKVEFEEEESEETNSVPVTRASRVVRSVKVERDPKPGYCENCRDKFDDFDAVSLPFLFFIFFLSFPLLLISAFIRFIPNQPRMRHATPFTRSSWRLIQVDTIAHPLEKPSQVRIEPEELDRTRCFAG